MKYIILTIAVEREGDYYVSSCMELGTASFGISEKEAIQNVLDATSLYLNTLEDLGECSAVLETKGVTVHEGQSVGPRMQCPPSSSVQSAVVPLPVYA